MDVPTIILLVLSGVCALCCAALLVRVSVLGDRLRELDDDTDKRIDRSVAAVRHDVSTLRSELGTMISSQNRLLFEMKDSQKESTDELKSSVRAELELIRGSVDEKLDRTLSKRLAESFGTVSGQLESLYKSIGEIKELSGGVTGSVDQLNRLLTNVKSRGTWAEAQLETILDNVLPGNYEKNFRASDGSSFVEFAVRLTDENGEISYLPIDSKFPLEDYRRLCEAADSGDREALDAAKKALERRVIAEARDISKYVEPPRTTPFAVMYLATEGLYAEVCSSKNEVAQLVQREYSVLVAGPATLTALLNSVAVGLRTAAVNKNAGRVMEVLQDVQKEYGVLCDLLDKSSKKITDAGEMIDKAQRCSDKIQKRLVSAADDENNEIE